MGSDTAAFRKKASSIVTGVCIAVLTAGLIGTVNKVLCHETRIVETAKDVESLQQQLDRRLQTIQEDQMEFRREYREDLQELKTLIKEARP